MPEKALETGITLLSIQIHTMARVQMTTFSKFLAIYRVFLLQREAFTDTDLDNFTHNMNILNIFYTYIYVCVCPYIFKPVIPVIFL